MSRGTEQVEGRRAVLELLRAGRRRVRSVWLAGDGLDEIEQRARAAGARVQRVPRDQLDRRARTDTPQGVVATADPVPETELDPLLRDDAAFLVALDGVTDPGNLGAVMRTAEAAGATGMIVPRHRAARITPAVAKAAAGALEHLPFVTVSGIPSALDRARRAHVWTVGLDADGDTALFDLALADQPLVLVLGAEGRGLSRLSRRRCDVVATIPMHGAIESLNVAAAAALACYEVARRRQ
ncbi:MAG TPA: 23S rRNA (guanosine(2251)-2'-O)-methyltransferase RlmB [Acidimicrobiia bacterium]